jgi:excinuclease UvrABC nuclease subunit
VKALVVVRRQREDRPPPEFSQSTVVPAAAVLKMQSQVRSSILKQIANAKAKGRTGTSRLKRGDTAAVVSLVVKNASEQAQLKIKQLEKRKRSSMSRLKSRLEKRKPRVKMTPLTTEPRVAGTGTSNHTKLVVPAELKIKKTSSI